MNSRGFLRALLWTLFTIIALISALLFYTSKLNVVELDYATYEDARAAGAFANAALPEFLPKSSRNIVSRRDLDANDSLVTFDFGSDFEHFLSQQRSADVSGAVGLSKRHGRFFSRPDELMYFPLLSSEAGLYNGSLLVNLAKGKAVYVEPPLK